MSQDNNNLDRWAGLSIPAIIRAAKPRNFTRDQQRTRRLLLEALKHAPEDVQNRVAQAALAARQAKLNQVTLNRVAKAARNAKRHTSGVPNNNNPADSESASEHELSDDQSPIIHKSPDRDLEHFLDLPTESEVRQLHRNFLSATSNAALAQNVCASCGRRLMNHELSRQDFLSLTNKHLLSPTKPHPLHVLTHGMLLEAQFLEETSDAVLGWICTHCLWALKQNRIPAYSLANGMWVGPMPTVLSMLTLPEQLLIALRYPRGYVVKLYSRSKSADHPDALQSGLRGNVTTYMTNAQAVTDMLSGQLMPRTMDVLPSLIAIAFIGRAHVSKSSLKYLLRVRRRMVYAALLELKSVTQHPGYIDLEIDETILASMPDDDVPDQVLSTVRVEPDEQVAQRESAGYVPSDNTLGSSSLANQPQILQDDHSDKSDLEAEATFSDQSSLGENPEFRVHSPQSSIVYEPGQDNEADVIPLEYSGTSAADGTHITPKELLLSAIENFKPNLKSQVLYEGGYAVRYGTFARDFGKRLPGSSESDDENPSCFTFPALFPFGLGGLEADRRVSVSFQDHTRWCLQYHDGRFRRHHTFPFWAFSIQQKRQALNASKLAMHRRDFNKAAAALSEITVDDLNQATIEEEQNKRLSNSKVVLLRRLVQVTMQRVMGSDASRALNRSKIWSTSLYLNPMSIWLTINLSDRHDPICQVFTGQRIDMDDFDPTSGPSPLERARNVASDPFAAAQFFFFLSETILETLFGFDVKGRCSQDQMGALGLGNAYFGAVEAQGRGSLHLHMLMWLRNAPNASETVEKLKSSQFREKIKSYIQANIHSHIDSLEQSVLDSMERDSGLPWSRPPDPDSPAYSRDLALLEIRLARSQQYHQCSDALCLRFDRRTKTKICKRGAPFECSLEDVVSESGEVKTRRLVAWLNAWNLAVFYGGRCNNDIKFITNGSQARNLGFYITNYATKKQGRSFNQSALITKTYMFHTARAEDDLTSRKSNESFLFRCGLAMNREQEFSGQQVMSYLMGWGDTIQSHTYTPIYWSAVVRALKAEFPELRTYDDKHEPNSIWPSAEEAQTEGQMNESHAGGSNTEAERIDVAPDGTWYLRSQIVDYQYRGQRLEHYNFLDYFVDTYEESASRSHPMSASRRGRQQNTRIPYLEPHPRSTTAVRVVRSLGHRNLPNIIGKWFERNDDPDTYDLHCASVLACLKPWRQLKELKDELTTWAQARSDFEATADDHQRCIEANMQYYYQCRDAADNAREAQEGIDKPKWSDGDELGDIEMSELINNIELSEALLSPKKREQQRYAERAIKIGRRLGMFDQREVASWLAGTETVTLASEEQYRHIKSWTDALHSMNTNNPTAPLDEAIQLDNGSVNQLDAIFSDESVTGATVEYAGDVSVESDVDPDVSMLSEEQLLAYTIVKNHLNAKTSSQLLLHIPGQGGTGKSLVIAKITDLLQARGQLHTLRKAAYTGIAASLIEGSTLHRLAELHLQSGTLSNAAVGRLRETWKHTKWLIIDEISMVSKRIFGSVSEMICIAKQEPCKNNNSIPFGGVNVIIAGDFHQFPPVVGQGPARGALYAPVEGTHSTKVINGQWLYSQFKKVVILRTQFRNEDPEWREILNRVRRGQCTPSDLKVIRSLIPKESQQALFAQPPWSDAVLITPRRSVRNRWNEEASRSHCLRTGNRLVISHAADYYKGQPVSPTIAALIAAREIPAAGEGGNARGDPGGLPAVVQLAKGMPVMVTVNVETEIDIANGSRGTIREIIVHNDEPGAGDDSLEFHLQRPPACVLVSLWRTRARPIEGLEDGVIPIVPTQGRFPLKVPGKGVMTIYREQIPLIPAYAFTDYRAQGQTLPYVIIDIGRPPSGNITPFNAYVALSRSRSKAQCRLLRDFDDELFTRPPNAALLAEDERLEDRDRLTRLEEGATAIASSG